MWRRPASMPRLTAFSSAAPEKSGAVRFGEDWTESSPMPDLLIRTEGQRDAARKVLEGIALDGKAWAFSLKRKQKARSLSQNALYWKWMDKIADETGHTKDELHEAVARMFLPLKSLDLGGEERFVAQTTTKLSVTKMSEYMDRIHAWAATDLGVHLPIPEEQHLEAQS